MLARRMYLLSFLERCIIQWDAVCGQKSEVWSTSSKLWFFMGQLVSPDARHSWLVGQPWVCQKRVSVFKMFDIIITRFLQQKLLQHLCEDKFLPVAFLPFLLQGVCPQCFSSEISYSESSSRCSSSTSESSFRVFYMSVLSKALGQPHSPT